MATAIWRLLLPKHYLSPLLTKLLPTPKIKGHFSRPPCFGIARLAQFTNTDKQLNISFHYSQSWLTRTAQVLSIVPFKVWVSSGSTHVKVHIKALTKHNQSRIILHPNQQPQWDVSRQALDKQEWDRMDSGSKIISNNHPAMEFPWFSLWWN